MKNEYNQSKWENNTKFLAIKLFERKYKLGKRKKRAYHEKAQKHLLNQKRDGKFDIFGKELKRKTLSVDLC